jgi:hypothetical protein
MFNGGLVMNQLALKDLSLSLIPKAGEDDFLYLLDFWYSSIVEDKGFPTISNNMFFQDQAAREVFLNFVDDIGDYYYAMSSMQTFDKNEFPISQKTFGDFQKDQAQAYFLDAYDTFIEFTFIGDMKKWLFHHNMFYIDQYSFELSFEEPKAKYINKPICEVW